MFVNDAIVEDVDTVVVVANIVVPSIFLEVSGIVVVVASVVDADAIVEDD